MKHDRSVAIGMFAVIGVMWYLTSQLGDSLMEGEPGPRFFPYVILTLMAVLTAIMFVGASLKSRMPREASASMRVEKGLPFGEAMSFFAVFLGGVALMKFVGFAFAMIPTLTTMLVMAKWKLFPKAILFSVITITIIFLIFDRLFQIPLPAMMTFH